MWELPIPYSILPISKACAECSLDRGRLSRAEPCYTTRGGGGAEPANSSNLTLSTNQEEFHKKSCKKPPRVFSDVQSEWRITGTLWWGMCRCHGRLFGDEEEDEPPTQINKKWKYSAELSAFISALTPNFTDLHHSLYWPCPRTNGLTQTTASVQVQWKLNNIDF